MASQQPMQLNLPEHSAMDLAELHSTDSAPSFALQLLDFKPPPSNAADNAMIVTSIVQRLVDVVSFRWANTVFA